MTPQKTIFTVIERRNVHEKLGKEWALNVLLDEGFGWTLCTWDKEPALEQEHNAIELAKRCFEFYHRHLTIPSFDMEFIEEKLK